MSDFPKVRMEDFVTEHNDAVDYDEANPIDNNILMETDNEQILQIDLSAIQAVLDKTNITEEFGNDNTVRKIAEEDGKSYYQVSSAFFNELASKAYELYDHNIPVEHIEDIAEAHTKQFLQDLHGYTGDFGGETAIEGEYFDATLCNAINDNNDDLTREDEPDSAHYHYNDSRGLVVTNNTHS